MIVFTIDAPVKQAALQLPVNIAAVVLEPTLIEATGPAGGGAVLDGWLAAVRTQDDLAWLRDRLRVPLMIKGVLHADAAAHRVALGCDGLVASNSGGSVLDGAPASSLCCLPSASRSIARA